MNRWQTVALAVALGFLALPLPGSVSGPPGGPEPNGALANNPLLAARELYDNEDATIQALPDADFEVAFAGWELYRVFEPTGVPPETHAMAWNGLGGYDMTQDYNAILSLSGATINSAGSAIAFAKPYANHANAEFQPERGWVDAGDSSRLNMTIEDPAASQSGIVWTVEISTYADQNGVLAHWSIQFKLNQLTTTRWGVVDTMVATDEFELEATNFRAGVWLNNTYGTNSYAFEASALQNGTWTPLRFDPGAEPLTELWNATNYDGSTWVAYYPSADLPTNTTPIVDVAKALVKAAKGAYGNMTSRNNVPGTSCFNQTNDDPNWGYESRDPDCVLRIEIYKDDEFLSPHVDIKIDHSNNVTLIVSAAYRELLIEMGNYLDPTLHDLETVARTVVGHEFYHVIQYGFNLLNPPWESWYEGQARAAQSFDVPSIENHTSSLWAYQLNNYMFQISTDFCALEYFTAPFWGLAYWQDGGLETITRVLENLNGTSGTCHAILPRAIDDALEQVGQNQTIAHGGFNETMLDLALHVFERNFTWGRFLDGPGGTQYEWGAFMTYPPETAQAAGSINYAVGAFAFDLVELVATQPFTLTVNVDDDNEWVSRLFNRSCEGVTTVSTLEHGEPTSLTPYECSEGTLVLTSYRKAPDGGEFQAMMEL